MKLHAYQERMAAQIVAQPNIGVFADMGVGKTLIALTAIADLFDRCEIRKVLIIAPLRVAQTVWHAESRQWPHTRHLTFALALGTEKQRHEAIALRADVTVCNRENVQWLVEAYGDRWPWDMLVIDELSSFKSPTAQRFRKLRKVRKHCRRIVGLTGTPASNGLLDLYPQVYLLDGGDRLGRTMGAYKQRWFRQMDRNGWRIEPLPGAAEEINAALSDLCLSLRAEDWLELPARVDNIVTCPLPPPAMKQYRELERKCVLDLETGTVTAISGGVLVNKLLQAANGAMYVEDREWEAIHDAKLDALGEILDEVSDNVLVGYSYRHDYERIKDRFPHAVEIREAGAIERWNKGEIRLLCAHPASAGHGLNLQHGGHTGVWFGLPWSLELYQQFCARLHRQGQKERVILHHLIAPGTVDRKVLYALQNKADVQDEVLNALRADVAALAA